MRRQQESSSRSTEREETAALVVACCTAVSLLAGGIRKLLRGHANRALLFGRHLLDHGTKKVLQRIPFARRSYTSSRPQLPLGDVLRRLQTQLVVATVLSYVQDRLDSERQAFKHAPLCR